MRVAATDIDIQRLIDAITLLEKRIAALEAQTNERPSGTRR